MPKNKTTAKKTKPEPDFFIPEKYRTPVFLGVILLLIIIFFKSGIFGDKAFVSADNLASGSFNTFLEDAKKTGIFALWIPYIFCGMPNFASLASFQERMYDISYAVYAVIRDFIYMLDSNSVWYVVFFYIVFAFSFYFLAEYKFKDKLIALYCAIAAVFITPIIQYIIVGHNSKMIAIMMFPAVLLFTEKIYDELRRVRQLTDGNPINETNDLRGGVRGRAFKLLLYFAAITFFIHIQMSSNHIQMLFYLYFAVGIYLLYELIYSLIKKTDIAAILKTILILAAAMVLSAMMYADSYLSIKEYNKYSIRGVPAITRQTEDVKAEQPLDYQYATEWSFSPAEMMTLIIPYWQGFGDVEYQGQRINTYWGQMYFTTSPVYFGVLTLLLALIGIYYNFRKNLLVQALTVLIFIAMLLSFGRTFPLLFDFMYYHFPMYSSFRAPVMAQILVEIPMVILAAFGLKSVIEIQKDRNQTGNFLYGAKYIFPLLALPVLFSIIGFEKFYNSLVSSGPLAGKLQQQGANQQQIQQYIGQVSKIAYDNVKSEMLVIGILLIALYGACYLYVKGKMKYRIFLGVVIILTLIDLWHIDFKTLHWDNKTDTDNAYKKPDYVDWILKNEKNTYDFRILNLNGGQPVRENTPAYWRLESLYGYHGAKIRIYQDMDDVAGLINPMVWNLSGTKYIISDKPYSDSNIVIVYKGSKYVLLNKTVLPKAFFVSSYRVADGLQILNNIKDENFNPKQVAFLEKDPGLKIEPAYSSAKVSITDYGIHNITLEAEASGNNLLYLSEVYYPAGWKAYIDGQQTEIYKTNYLFRSIAVPGGKHKIEFKFEPEAYSIGKKITIAGNALLIIIFVTAVSGIYWKRKKL